MTYPAFQLVNAPAPAQAIESSRFFDQPILLAFAALPKAPSFSWLTHDTRPEANQPAFAISGFMTSFGLDGSADAGNEPTPSESTPSCQDGQSDLPITAASSLGGNLPPELGEGGSGAEEFVTPDGIWFDVDEISEIQASDFTGRSPNDPADDAESSDDEIEIEAAEAEPVPAHHTGGGGNNAGNGNGGIEFNRDAGAPTNAGGAWCGACVNITLGLMVGGALVAIGYAIAESVTGVPEEDPDTPYYPSNLEVHDQVFAPVATAPGAGIGEPVLHEITAIRELLHGWNLHVARDRSVAPTGVDDVEAQELPLIGSPSHVFIA